MLYLVATKHKTQALISTQTNKNDICYMTPTQQTNIQLHPRNTTIVNLCMHVHKLHVAYVVCVYALYTTLMAQIYKIYINTC